ncbi:DUF3846 domain-containing protein [Lachnospiraceae bacterium 29-91]
MEEMNYNYEEQETDREGNQAAERGRKDGMTVLVVEPLKAPYLKTISGELKSLQKEVGGLIDATYPFEDRVAVVLNDEGKLDGLMPNRGLYNHDGSLYDIIAGTFLVVGLAEESFCSLSEEMAAKYMEKYKTPERVAFINGEIIMLPVSDGRKADSRILNDRKSCGEPKSEIQMEAEARNKKSQEKKSRKRNRANEER